jgi:hypothetical protein
MKTVGVNVENELAMLDDPLPPSAAVPPTVKTNWCSALV